MQDITSDFDIYFTHYKHTVPTIHANIIGDQETSKENKDNKRGTEQEGIKDLEQEGNM